MHVSRASSLVFLFRDLSKRINVSAQKAFHTWDTLSLIFFVVKRNQLAQVNVFVDKLYLCSVYNLEEYDGQENGRRLVVSKM